MKWTKFLHWFLWENTQYIAWFSQPPDIEYVFDTHYHEAESTEIDQHGTWTDLQQIRPMIGVVFAETGLFKTCLYRVEEVS